MKNVRFLLVLFILNLCLLALAHPVNAVQPETMRFVSVNPGFGDPCPEPPDLGFVPIASYSETIDLESPDGQTNMGSAKMCHFVKSIEENPEVWTQINFTVGEFYFSEGVVHFGGELRLRGLPDGSVRVKLRGDITGGSEAYASVEGMVRADGKVLFDDQGTPLPDILFVLKYR